MKHKQKASMFTEYAICLLTSFWILNFVVCILLRVLDQVQGFPSNATLFQ
jgi:hypothetical protein